jgi:hypothetical protein
VGRVLAFQAVLSTPPVERTIAIREDQTLEQLHEALRLAFGWADPHLYAFWLDGEFWSQTSEMAYYAPFELEEGQRSARTPLAELGLQKGKNIAYLFDFGDEWRLMLKLVDAWEADEGEGAYPMLVEAEGIAPPQYPTLDEDEPGE